MVAVMRCRDKKCFAAKGGAEISHRVRRSCMLLFWASKTPAQGLQGNEKVLGNGSGCQYFTAGWQRKSFFEHTLGQVIGRCRDRVLIIDLGSAVTLEFRVAGIGAPSVPIGKGRVIVRFLLPHQCERPRLRPGVCSQSSGDRPPG
jgi:hypothetical protein